MKIKTAEGDITASKGLINYISILASEASKNYESRGLDGLADQARDFSNKLYEWLDATGAYDEYK